MIAIEKIEALTVKAVHAACDALEPGLALETVYRWLTALKAGKGISDARKTLLIKATSASDHAIVWADFAPVDVDALSPEAAS